MPAAFALIINSVFNETFAKEMHVNRDAASPVGFLYFIPVLSDTSNSFQTEIAGERERVNDIMRHKYSLTVWNIIFLKEKLLHINH